MMRTRFVLLDLAAKLFTLTPLHNTATARRGEAKEGTTLRYRSLQVAEDFAEFAGEVFHFAHQCYYRRPKLEGSLPSEAI